MAYRKTILSLLIINKIAAMDMLYRFEKRKLASAAAYVEKAESSCLMKCMCTNVKP